MALEGKKYVINGYDVYFPYKPYGPQFAFMGKVLATCESSRSKGNANALLESPTGSGKTLALLCATLAWQHHFKMNKLIEIKAAAQPAWQQTGGGFLPEDADADATCSGGDARELQTKGNKGHRENKKQEKKPGVPKIIYATRTHSQIAQVIRELKKSSYKPSMAILASRKQYCTNKVSAKKGNVDEECKKLLHDVNKGCPQFKNMHKVRDHESLESGRPNSIHDIEDLVDVARSVKGCAYFASKTLAIGADIVFCPYNYILDPVIRRSMEIDLKGSILIFDEAHNIEDCAREAVTFNIELGSLEDLGGELDRLTTSEGLEPYGPLLQIIQGLSSWLREKSAQLRLQTSEASPQIWEGHQAARELENAGFSSRDLTDLLKFCKKAVDSSTTVGTGLDSMTLSGRGASILEGLFTVLNFMFGNDTQRLNDYRLVVQKHMNRDEAKGTDICVTSLGFWCLNPAVAFDSIIHISRAIILTSGTLAPMETFASELGLRFEASMEGSHVIDVEKQIWAASLSVGPGGVPFNASFKNADNPTFQDTLGAALEAFCRAIPDGVLVFFPSYKLLEKLSMRWKTTGRWKSLGSVKKIFIEPKGNDDQFQQTLKGYYRAIAGNLGQSKAGKGTLARKAAAPKNTGSTVKPGAVFFAVCRGKVSEGIDFADANARGVIIIGIPFPNVKDPQVSLKKQYNNNMKHLRGLLSGDQWYCQQAYRALNQAVGRCIRHRHDYGAVILLDERFQARNNMEHMSKWIRKAIKPYDKFERSIEDVKSFFSSLKGFPSDSTLGTSMETKMFPVFKLPKLCSGPDETTTESDHVIANENSSTPLIPSSHVHETKKQLRDLPAVSALAAYFGCPQRDPLVELSHQNSGGQRTGTEARTSGGASDFSVDSRSAAFPCEPAPQETEKMDHGWSQKRHRDEEQKVNVERMPRQITYHEKTCEASSRMPFQQWNPRGFYDPPQEAFTGLWRVDQHPFSGKEGNLIFEDAAVPSKAFPRQQPVLMQRLSVLSHSSIPLPAAHQNDQLMAGQPEGFSSASEIPIRGRTCVEPPEAVKLSAPAPSSSFAETIADISNSRNISREVLPQRYTVGNLSRYPANEEYWFQNQSHSRGGSFHCNENTCGRLTDFQSTINQSRQQLERFCRGPYRGSMEAELPSHNGRPGIDSTSFGFQNRIDDYGDDHKTSLGYTEIPGEFAVLGSCAAAPLERRCRSIESDDTQLQSRSDCVSSSSRAERSLTCPSPPLSTLRSASAALQESSIPKPRARVRQENRSLAVSCRMCGAKLLHQTEDSVKVEGAIHEMSLKKQYLYDLRKQRRAILGDESAIMQASDVYVLEPKLFQPSEGFSGWTSLNTVKSEGDEVWVKEDGCVYSPIKCSFCQRSNSWVGAHVLASDGANSFLTTMVILLKECILMEAAGTTRNLCQRSVDDGKRKTRRTFQAPPIPPLPFQATSFAEKRQDLEAHLGAPHQDMKIKLQVDGSRQVLLPDQHDGGIKRLRPMVYPVACPPENTVQHRPTTPNIQHSFMAPQYSASCTAEASPGQPSGTDIPSPRKGNLSKLPASPVKGMDTFLSLKGDLESPRLIPDLRQGVQEEKTASSLLPSATDRHLSHKGSVPSSSSVSAHPALLASPPSCDDAVKLQDTRDGGSRSAKEVKEGNGEIHDRGRTKKGNGRIRNGKESKVGNGRTSKALFLTRLEEKPKTVPGTKESKETERTATNSSNEKPKIVSARQRYAVLKRKHVEVVNELSSDW